MPIPVPEDRNGAPPFTPKQVATILKIARKRGIPARDRDDFVKTVWLEVDRCWAKVPKKEPDTSRYINGMAYNMACDVATKRAKDPTVDPVLFSSLPRDFTPPQQATDERRILAQQLMTMAAARDPQGADWVYRSVVEEEPPAEIAASEGEKPDTVRKRVTRLLAWMREKGGVIITVVVCLFVGARWARSGLFSDEHAVSAPAPQTPSAHDRAEPLRVEAFAACGDQRFQRCEELLDEALAIDPDGENDPRVLDARDAIARAARPAPEPSPAP